VWGTGYSISDDTAAVLDLYGVPGIKMQWILFGRGGDLHGTERLGRQGLDGLDVGLMRIPGEELNGNIFGKAGSHE
jgi:hypothetical protein